LCTTLLSTLLQVEMEGADNVRPEKEPMGEAETAALLDILRRVLATEAAMPFSAPVSLLVRFLLPVDVLTTFRRWISHSTRPIGTWASASPRTPLTVFAA
jgi:hypothetical protein